jgi:hypothetical protein
MERALSNEDPHFDAQPNISDNPHQALQQVHSGEVDWFKFAKEHGAQGSLAEHDAQVAGAIDNSSAHLLGPNHQ